MTSLESLQLLSNNVTNWKAWAQRLSINMLAAGWQQEVVAGSIDWSTVAAVPANNYTAPPFEVLKMGDVLQATAPIYARLEYSQRNIRIRIGSAHTNGVITNPTNPPSYLGPGVDQAAPSSCYFSGSSSRFTACLWAATGDAWLYSIERLANNSGQDSSLGAYIVGLESSSELFYQVAQPGGLGPGLLDKSNSTFGAPTVRVRENSVFGNAKAVSPLYPQLSGWMNPSRNLVSGKNTEVTLGEQVSISLYGLNLAFIGMKTNNSAVQTAAPGQANAWLMRWE